METMTPENELVDLSQLDLASTDDLFDLSVQSVLTVPEPISASDWADEHFYLTSDSSSQKGKWTTSPVQRAILNAMGSDAIERVVFYKPTRFGGTKMAVAAMLYFIAHKRRNGCFYMPTQPLSEAFVKTEVSPAIQDCKEVYKRKRSFENDSPDDTLKYKAFDGSVFHFRGGHTPSAYESLTLHAVFLDEIDQFPTDVGGRGDPITLSWGRVRESAFKKQVILSKPTIEGSNIDCAAKDALDNMIFQALCPECEEHMPIEWGGPDVPYGFKWRDGDPKTVVHVCKGCGVGWENHQLIEAVDKGYWLGRNGYKTFDSLEWEKDGVACDPPRVIAFSAWSGYSDRLSWVQLVNEWLDAQGSISKIKSFKNNTLAQTWRVDLEGATGVSPELLAGIVPTDDLDEIFAATAGIDVQEDRLEVQILGHDRDGNLYVLDYLIYYGDTKRPEVYTEMHNDLRAWSIEVTPGRRLKVMKAGIDTAYRSGIVFSFLRAARRYRLVVGIRGSLKQTEVSRKRSRSKEHSGEFWTLGSNPLKREIYSAIMNIDKKEHSFRIATTADLPLDYSDQITVEQMVQTRRDGVDRIEFRNLKKKPNEAIDTAYYALAMKYWCRLHGTAQQRRAFR